MGLRFDLSVANWIAFVIDERAEVPTFSGPFGPGAKANGIALETFLDHLRHGLMSSLWANGNWDIGLMSFSTR
jgi:hypothetical protein